MPITARRCFYENLLKHGFTLIRLYKATRDHEGNLICACRKGIDCRNQGKHPDSRFQWRSIVTNLDEIEQHLDQGGSIGLGLWFYPKHRTPASPGRLVIFDCDDEYGLPWLREQGITSYWEVHGQRGAHVYCRLPDDVPELKSDTRTLQAPLPKIDIKVSGLVVLPWSPNKVLYLHGRDASNDPAAVDEFFRDFPGLLGALPAIDPRVIAPKMNLRYPVPAPSAKAATPSSIAVAVASSPAQAPATARVALSATKPLPEAYSPEYAELPYYERKRLGRSHAGKVKPSVQGQEPKKKLLFLVRNLILNYGLSHQDAWLAVRDKFNPRCTAKDGRRYRWLKTDVAHAIEFAVQEGSYSSLSIVHVPLDRRARYAAKMAGKDVEKVPVDQAAVLVRLKAKGEQANQDRQLAAQERASEIFASIHTFFQECCELDPNEAAVFSLVHDAACGWMSVRGIQTVSKKRLGMYLRVHGMDTDSVGRVQGLRLSE